MDGWMELEGVLRWRCGLGGAEWFVEGFMGRGWDRRCWLYCEGCGLTRAGTFLCVKGSGGRTRFLGL